MKRHERKINEAYGYTIINDTCGAILIKKIYKMQKEPNLSHPIH